MAAAASESTLGVVRFGSSSVPPLACVLYRVVSQRMAAFWASSQVVTSGSI